MWPRRTLKPDGSSFNQPPASRDTANSQCRATSQRPSAIPHFLFVQTMNRLHPVAATGPAPPARWAVGALPPSRKTQEREAAKTDKQKQPENQAQFAWKDAAHILAACGRKPPINPDPASKGVVPKRRLLSLLLFQSGRVAPLNTGTHFLSNLSSTPHLL